MASLNLQSASLEHPTVRGGRPNFTVNGTKIIFDSPFIFAKGSVELNGAANEDVTGWKLGFVQLQFVETNYSTYRGRLSAHGSIKDSGSHSKLCRDTDERQRTRVPWYDPDDLGKENGRGLFRARHLSGAGNLRMATGFGDAPGQDFETELQNTRTLATNFLHHSDIAFHFCTMLVAEDPRRQFTVLKHFYWNVRWEAHFHTNADGRLQLTRIDHFELNVQRQVHSGIPNDGRFRSKVFDLSLPISNVEANRPHRLQFGADWSLA